MTSRSGLLWSGCLALLIAAGLQAAPASYAATTAVRAESSDTTITPAQLRAVREEFADVSGALDQQSADLTELVAHSDQWLTGLTGVDPGTGQPWEQVVSGHLTDARNDIRRMQGESKNIADLISQALSSARNGNDSAAFRKAQSVATLVNRLTDDAANSGRNISLTLGTAQPMLEKVGNDGGLGRIAASLGFQSGLMRNLQQTEKVIPSKAFKDVLSGDVEPAEIKAVRQDFRSVASTLNQQLADLSYLLSGKSAWKQGSQDTDPGTGQPWGVILGQMVEVSRNDVQRLDLRADCIAASLSRAFRSAQQDNEGGIRLSLRAAAQDLTQLSADAQGVGNGLTMTLTSTRPLLDAVDDQAGLNKINQSLQLQTDLLNRIQQAQRTVTENLQR